MITGKWIKYTLLAITVVFGVIWTYQSLLSARVIGKTSVGQVVNDQPTGFPAENHRLKVELPGGEVKTVTLRKIVQGKYQPGDSITIESGPFGLATATIKETDKIYLLLLLIPAIGAIFLHEKYYKKYQNTR